jgi:hypothetical protein
MSDPKRDPSKPASKPEKPKKTAETVNLTSEELRRISGGQIGTPQPPPKPKAPTSK